MKLHSSTCPPAKTRLTVYRRLQVLFSGDADPIYREFVKNWLGRLGIPYFLHDLESFSSNEIVIQKCGLRTVGHVRRPTLENFGKFEMSMKSPINNSEAIVQCQGVILSVLDLTLGFLVPF